ncbi:MAG TPA: TetR family transcriptional regulator [Solirubrobacterales bacterium]|jgi:AcrR family transcriptional regulator|nr:TetR family transcriptional regulator [Solirubrobacterales bacterium]
MSNGRTPYQEATRELLRKTVFDAAREQLGQQPWSEITMADIASGAGVSRQTLYNEFGNRNEFGFAFVIHEAERFMDGVEKAVLGHTDDPRAAVLAALEHFLRTAGEDPLISILLSDDGTGGMLPFVTTQGLPVVQWATARLTAVIEEGWPEAPEADVKLLAEALVRLSISYVTTPGESAEEAASAAAELLGPFIDMALGSRSP